MELLYSQGFFYDAFYGELGLNDDHFDAIACGAQKAVAVHLISSYKSYYLWFNI